MQNAPVVLHLSYRPITVQVIYGALALDRDPSTVNDYSAWLKSS
jgi:hypothetical protein